MKFLYCISCLYNPGGMERVLSIKANYLVRRLGYDVTIVTISQFDKPVYYELDSRIKVVNLDIHQTIYHPSKNFTRRKLINLRNARAHKQRLTNFLKKNKFDFCISLLDGHESFFLPDIQDGSIKIAEFHYSSFIYESGIKTASGLRKRYREYILQKFVNQMRKYDQFVVLTEEDKRNWEKYNLKVKAISNPLSFSVEDNEISRLENKKALAVGRLVELKGFDVLINVWSIVQKEHNDWELNIYGGGNLEEKLTSLIKEKKLEKNVYIKKPVKNIKDVFVGSSIFILTSKHEGMPLALMESMACGLPAVSFNCQNGPSELIDDGHSGFLIENFDKEKMAEKIIYLMNNNESRKKMGLEAKKNSKAFEIEEIMKKWDNLFKNLKNQDV